MYENCQKCGVYIKKIFFFIFVCELYIKKYFYKNKCIFNLLASVTINYTYFI